MSRSEKFFRWRKTLRVRHRDTAVAQVMIRLRPVTTFNGDTEGPDGREAEPAPTSSALRAEVATMTFVLA